MTWNPTGFMQKAEAGGACYGEPPHGDLGLAESWGELTSDPEGRTGDMLEWEKVTPLAAEGAKEVEAAVVRGLGVGVVGQALDAGTVEHFRGLAENRNGPVCDEAFAPLVSNLGVLEMVGGILGNGFRADGVEVKVVQPGQAGGLGAGKEATPKNFPASVEVVYMLDDFTAVNGAPFVVPDAYEGKGVEGGGEGAKFVTGAAGSIAFVNGGVAGGTAPNYTDKPRVAVSVRYVRSFVGATSECPLT